MFKMCEGCVSRWSEKMYVFATDGKRDVFDRVTLILVTVTVLDPRLSGLLGR